MKYRGQECSERPFSDETGEGIEYFLPATEDRPEFVAIREHKRRVVSQAELDASAAAATAADDAGTRAAALALLVDETIAKRSKAVAAKLAAMREAPTPALGTKLP